MKELLQVIAKVDSPILYFGEVITPVELLNERIHNDGETGWYFGAGDPEFWKFKDRFIVPGGKVLDLGAGFGRTSVPFALQGMSVTAYETNEERLAALKILNEAYDLPIETRAEDFINAQFEHEEYDTVLLAQSLIHSSSKREALSVLSGAITATKSRGYLWLRAAGIYDESFEELEYLEYDYPEITRIDQNVYMAPCTCSGEWRIEPQLFLDPMEIAVFLTSNGLDIVHSQVIPQRDRKNIMFGEDWRKGGAVKKSGVITFLGQKRI